MVNSIDNVRFVPSGPGWSRPGVVFTAAAVALLAAFLLPFGSKLLDVLWVCTFSLALATTFICVAAKSSSDLPGFVPLIFGLTLLRLFTSASTARAIIRDEPSGVLIKLAGTSLASAWPLTAVLLALLLSVIFVFVVFAACRRITHAAVDYVRRILPLKRMGIQADLQLGVIDESRAADMARRVVAESRFFTDMHGTGLLMRAEAAICLLLLPAALILPMLGRSVDSAVAAPGWTASAPLVVALSLFALVPAAIVAAACGSLMNKGSLALKADSVNVADSPDKADAPAGTKKVTVVALDETRETGNDSRSAARAEQVAEFEPNSPTATDESLSAAMDLSCRNAKEYYEKLSRLIDTVDARPRVILLAAEKLHALPVTVAVNIAVRLAQKQHKVLLVDADNQRNAVAQVFDLDPNELQKKIKSSTLENLALCCVAAAKLQPFLCKSDILRRFDATLIYTPNIDPLNITAGAAFARPGALYFMDELVSEAPATVADKLDFCGWLRLMPSIRSILTSNP